MTIRLSSERIARLKAVATVNQLLPQQILDEILDNWWELGIQPASGEPGAAMECSQLANPLETAFLIELEPFSKWKM